MWHGGERHLGHHGGEGLALRDADDGGLGGDDLLLLDKLVQQLARQLALLGDDERDVAAAHPRPRQRCGGVNHFTLTC